MDGAVRERNFQPILCIDNRKKRETSEPVYEQVIEILKKSVTETCLKQRG